MSAVLHKAKVWTWEVPCINKITLDRQRLHETQRANEKLRIVRKLDVLFPLNLNGSVIIFQ